jgi:hypothetical protein
MKSQKVAFGLSTYPFMHIMFTRLHELGKRVADILLRGDWADIIVELRVVHVNVIS